MMIVNTMTHRGYVMALSRHGMNRMETSPFIRCSFEETLDVIHDAAMHSEKDSANGVTQNVMTGQSANMGTGCFDILELNPPEEFSKKRRLVKSQMTNASMGSTSCKNAIEYLDKEHWSWHLPKQADVVEAPFSVEETTKESSLFMVSTSSEPYYDIQAVSGTNCTPSYVPSSPVSDDDMEVDS